MPFTVDTAVQFWPRGGSAQVVRYVLRELNARGHTTRLHAGSLGEPGEHSHASTFYQGLDLRPYDHNDALNAWQQGHNPQLAPVPFHPSYEDRGTCPDSLFSAVAPAAADHLTRAWTRHLTAHRSTRPDVLHLHHLSHLQTSARAAYADVPRITTLHGTELKLVDAMAQRIRLTRRTGYSLADLARLLHPDNPHRSAEALRLAKTAGFDEQETALLATTAWQKWVHAEYWHTRLKQTLAHSGRLITVSAHDQDLAARLLPLHRPIPVIPNGVDTHVFRPRRLDDTERLQHLRHWLVTDPRGWGPDGTAGSIRYTDRDLHRLRTHEGRLRPLLLWVGRYLAFKKIPVLLRAFAAARPQLDPAPALLMWGGYPGECEGDHPADLATQLGIDDDVFFIGWRGHDELPAGLNCADLMVAPAVNEPFGMVYLEAMACAVPPIATATGGPLRTIIPAGPNATGWLVPPDDPDALAHTLTAALRNTAGRTRRADKARKHVEDTYSWSRTADHYLTAYATAQEH